MRNAYDISLGKPEGKRPLGRPGCRWEDNIRMDLKDIRLDWIALDASGSGYGPVAGSCEHGYVPSGYIKGGEFLDQLSDC
jgi:hypothetical protein